MIGLTQGQKLFAALALLLLSSLAAAREVLVVFGTDKPPFVFSEGKQGLEIDIVREALKHVGHTLKIALVSYRRLPVALKTMQVDGSASVHDADDGSFYSAPFIEFDNCAVSRKIMGLDIRSIADLKGKSIAAWQNAYRDLGAEYQALFSPDKNQNYPPGYFEVSSQRDQNIMFWAGRADVLIIDKTIFLWYRKALGREMDTDAEVVYHDIFPVRTFFQVGFKSKELRDQFDDGLRYLRESGRYQQLVNKYIK